MKAQYPKMNTLRLRWIYAEVALIELALYGSPRSFIHFDWSSSDITDALVVPNKASLLSRYAEAIISDTYKHEFAQLGKDIWFEEYLEEPQESVIARLEQIFQSYQINIPPFETFLKQHKDPDNGKPVCDWFSEHYEIFGQLWNKVAEDVFRIMFSNRTFLLDFNLKLAEHLSSHQKLVPTRHLSKNGVLRRAKHIPRWLKKAVFYRDHGRCVFCQKDLSGLLNTENLIHLDHMVPLAKWGTNDPCNFQLTCSECNLSKSDRQGTTTDYYPRWW